MSLGLASKNSSPAARTHRSSTLNDRAPLDPRLRRCHASLCPADPLRESSTASRNAVRSLYDYRRSNFAISIFFLRVPPLSFAIHRHSLSLSLLSLLPLHFVRTLAVARNFAPEWNARRIHDPRYLDIRGSSARVTRRRLLSKHTLKI